MAQLHVCRPNEARIQRILTRIRTGLATHRDADELESILGDLIEHVEIAGPAPSREEVASCQ